MKQLTRTTVIILAAAVMVTPAGCRRKARMERERREQAQAVARSEAVEAVTRAKLLDGQGLEEPALAEFQRAIELNPTIAPAYIGIGDINTRRSNWPEALRYYSKAVEVEPQIFRGHYGEGLALQMLGRVTEAIRSYLRAMQISPNDFDANLNLATAYLQQGEAALGLFYAQRAVKVNPQHGPARVNLGAIYAALGEHDRAVSEYQQAAELMELTPELLLNLAESLGKTGKHAEMQAVLEQLVQKRASAAGYERLATALFRQAKYPESLDAFRKALELDANYFPAHNGVGVCLLNKYIESNKTDTESRLEGLKALERSLQIEPKQPSVADLLSRYRQG